MSIIAKALKTILPATALRELAHYDCQWTIRKYDGVYAAGMEPVEVSKFGHNVLLSEGITEFLRLLIGSAATPWNNANTYLGVGDSNTAAAASQTGLLAVTNRLYKPMEAGYPQLNGTKVTFRSTFGPSEANWDWREFSVANGSDNSATNLNRKVDNQGTKAEGQTWALDLEITWV